METLVAGDLRIEAVDPAPPGNLIRLHWSGKSNDRHPDHVLRPYFGEVVSAAQGRRVSVEMHFEKLEHFNSSTITAIIQLIQDARARGVRLVLVYDDKLKWQKLSFDALRVLARGDDLLTLKSV